MSKKPSPFHCLSCGHSDQDVPLIPVRFGGGDSWICPQCLPILIHHGDKLAGKLAELVREPSSR